MKMICDICESEMRCVCDVCEPQTLTVEMTPVQHEQLHKMCGEDLLSMMSRFGLCGASMDVLNSICDREANAYKLGFINGQRKEK